jgi:mono/diheme cytochrome c family protein
MLAGATFAMLGAGAARAAETTPPGFHNDVLPILQQHCGQCHTPGGVGYQAINLDLTNYRGVMNGSTHGQVVIPRQPQMSPLVKVLDWSKDKYPHMPATGHELSKQDVATIGAWIAAGAKDN